VLAARRAGPDQTSTLFTWATRGTADRIDCPRAQVLHLYHRLGQSSRQSL
jgi:hypothetical protein